MCKSEKPKYISKEKYYSDFEIYPDQDNILQVKNPEKINKAYERAWKNRDFEIDKLWSRTAYFWAFIVLCFTGYGVLKFGVIGEQIAINGNHLKQIFLLAISALGIVLSLIWWLSIIASKRWQENWEYHIDCLENFVTGPLYKTISFKRFNPSVSKLNLLLSIIILIVWIILFIIEFCNALECKISKSIDFNRACCYILFGLFITIIFIFLYLFKYNIQLFNIFKGVKRFVRLRSPEDYFEEEETNNTKDNK